ncbi:hypothetical protein Tco_1114067 [Tanacetum coccineum]|uniref:Uncharacterized protein n=1 Tax=Tanacetum coccineum TaxID=301880 RepID=A0ABQ5IU45_9ASTR
MQKQESKVDLGKALDVGLVVIKRSGTESRKKDTSSMSENDTDTDDADIRPIYDEEPMDEYTEKCQVKSLMLDSSLDNKTTGFLNQSLKQQGQILNETSNKAKIKKEIDAFETINKELENSVAKLLAENEHLHKENEHLKQTYKDHYDSIEKSRVQTKDNNESLIVQLKNKSTKNVDLKAQIQEKVFAVASLKNELRKFKGNSVDTKWIPTRKLLNSCMGTIDCEPPHGSNVDIFKIHKSKQTIDLSAGTSINVQKKKSIDLSAGTSYNVKKEKSQSVVAEKSDISETSVTRDTKPTNKNNDS